MTTIATPWAWVGFVALILVLLAVDLGLHSSEREMRTREALAWSVAWIALGVGFGFVLWAVSGPKAGLEYLTGYLVEKALSVDNIFVFLVLFGYFRVPVRFRHRVLYWGILGAMILRAGFILTGAALLSRFDWLFYVFGIVLLWSGGKLFAGQDPSVDPEHSTVMRLFRRFVPMTAGYRGQRFVVREGGRVLATPLLLVLAMVELTDVVFATDSIPAIFGVTRDPFIVFSSNVFAILGLRALFGVLQGVLERLRFLEHGLGLILVGVGLKMLLHRVWEPPTGLSLGVIGGILTLSVVASLVWPAPPGGGPAAGDAEGEDAPLRRASGE